MPLLRQTPGSAGVWGKYRFVPDAAADEGPYDAWVVYNNLPGREVQYALCPRGRTILIIGEPPSRGAVHPGFASQFGTVVTCHPGMNGARIRKVQQALPWWVGLRRAGMFQFDAVMGYDGLAGMTSVPKTKDLSIICSDLAITPGHRRRVRFVSELIRHFGDRMDVFGQGRRPVEDKWDAIAPYKYHVVLENSSIDDYWTEKLADAFLGAALPIYWGCRNIERYFSRGALIPIDIARPADVIRKIERVLSEDPYQEMQKDIWRAREKVLDEFNLFPMIARFVDALPQGEAEPVHLHPASDFPLTPPMRLRHGVSLVRELVVRSWTRARGQGGSPGRPRDTKVW